MNKKIGRNDRCPCGSGKKFKKCCLEKDSGISNILKNQFDRLQAKQIQTQKQQGLGKGIISNSHNGTRFVAVGNGVHYSRNWKTFHDFLFDYIPAKFGKGWGVSELSKPSIDQHPIVQWRQLSYAYMRTHQSGDAQIQTTEMTGAITAFLTLSYNLYLLAHNVKLQSRLIKRLKDKGQFNGAKYETYVAAEFIKAGFSLEMEDETDGKTTHCEFTATFKNSGKKYSVEAKARQPGKDNVSVATQLSKALAKKADHERVIFIDINIQNFASRVDEIMAEIRRHETELLIDHKPAPAAYLFITNHPFEYGLQNIYERKNAIAHGFKIPDFDFEPVFKDIRDLLKAREKHREMFALVHSIREHEEIPSTFDGEYPEFAFNSKDAPPRLIIGKKYLVPTKDGKDVEGELTTACVLESKKEIAGVYHTITGENIMCTYPMTEEEFAAYKKQPETFFGIPQKTNGNAETPLELFDFFYATYKTSPRERLLEFMKGWPNQDILKSTSTEELAITYCESLVQYAFSKEQPKPPTTQA
ncbi:MAG: SEC-C metal-binding domain-containing protein [Elusimicrobiota bacterium]